MIENDSPELAARIDVVLFAFITSIKIRDVHAFELAFRKNVAIWRDSLIATRVCDTYLDELDARVESMLAMILTKK